STMRAIGIGLVVAAVGAGGCSSDGGSHAAAETGGVPGAGGAGGAGGTGNASGGSAAGGASGAAGAAGGALPNGGREYKTIVNLVDPLVVTAVEAALK